MSTRRVRPRRKLKTPPLRRLTPEELREWRIRYDLTQDELAKLIGVSQKTVSHWETGARKIPPYLVLLLEYLKKEGYIPQE